MSDLGDAIAAHREALGITQTQLAKDLGVTKSYISHIEAGRRPVSDPMMRLIEGRLGSVQPNLQPFTITVVNIDQKQSITVHALDLGSALRSASHEPAHAWEKP